MSTNLCHSCGNGFEAALDSLIICPDCVIRREQVKCELTRVFPVSNKAKELAASIEEFLLRRKFLMAANTIDELKELVQVEAREAFAHRERDRAKKERWHARQGERRSQDQARSHSGGSGGGSGTRVWGTGTSRKSKQKIAKRLRREGKVA